MKRTVVLLQGPSSFFFGHLADALQQRGATVERVIVCPGDAIFWGKRPSVAFRENAERDTMKVMNQDLVVVLMGYVRGRVTSLRLTEWLAQNIWELSRSPSPLDRMILGELELALAEYDRGDRTEAYLRERVRFLLSLPNPNLVARLRETARVSRS